MKTGEKLSKIVSTSIALIVCSAVLAFALTALCWGAALPAHATSATCSPGTLTLNTTSGPVGATVHVTGTNINEGGGACYLLTSGPVSFGYSTSSSICTSPNSPGSGNSTWTTPGSFTGTFTWPPGASSTSTPYYACTIISGSIPAILISSNTFAVTTTATATATATGTVTPTVTPTATTTASGSVSVDTSSYTVGDTMTVTGTGFPHSTSVAVKLQSSDGKTTTTLGTAVQTDGNGAFTQDYTVPAHPLNSVVVIVTYGSSQQATSGSFTVKAKSSSSSSSTHAPAPAPAPASAPPPPAPVYYPPAALAATPTPVPTATPTPVPTATDTPTPVPTVAPIPTQVPVVANHTTSLFGNLLGGKLPLVLAIGLGTLIGLSLLFVVGRVLLGKFLSPSPAPTISPSGTSPWMGSQGNSLQGNTMMNGVPLGQTMPFDSSFPPGNGGFAPGYGSPQQVPFNSPFGSGNGEFAPVPGNGPFQPADGGFAPGPGNSPQPVPMGGPYQPGTSGFAPVNANQQEPLPPDSWFASPN